MKNTCFFIVGFFYFLLISLMKIQNFFSSSLFPASRSRSARRKEPKPATPPGERGNHKTIAGPRPAADPGPPVEPEAAGKSGTHPSNPESQPQLSRPVTAAPEGQQPSANEVS